MNKAKLIKREDWLEQERERLARRLALRSHAGSVTRETIRDWVKRNQAAPKPESRRLFATLFV
ncbi:MAG: hypothetical protein ACKV2V_13370 [Blastocatellia bacterium]